MRNDGVVPARLGAAVAACLLVVACAGPPSETITAAVAVDRLTGYLRDTLAGVRTGLHFTRLVTSDSSSCVGGNTDSGFTGQVEAQVDFVAKTDASGGFLAAVRSYWRGKGYSVTSDPDHLDANTPDGYDLFVVYSPAVHELDLGGHSMCLWPDGRRPGG